MCDLEYAVALRRIDAAVGSSNQIVDTATGGWCHAQTGWICRKVCSSDSQGAVGCRVERIEEQRLRIAIGLFAAGQHSETRYLNVGHYQTDDGRCRLIGAAYLRDSGNISVGGRLERPSVNRA